MNDQPDLSARFAELQARMAAPLPTAEQLAEWTAEDRAFVPRIHAARPGVPAHHIFAVLQTLRSVRHYDSPTELGTLPGTPNDSSGSVCACGEGCPNQVPGPAICPGHADCPRCDVTDPCPCCGLRYINGKYLTPTQAGAALVRVVKLAADMRSWCSPHGIAVDYAQRIDDAIDGEDAESRSTCTASCRHAISGQVEYCALDAGHDYPAIHLSAPNATGLHLTWRDSYDGANPHRRHA